ncbi:MAG: hypothetical protein Q8O09_06280 [Bacillota bacterium]|nr:hypothetical protein [Bacillota bacterium]
MGTKSILRYVALFLCLSALPCMLFFGERIEQGLHADIFRDWLKLKKPSWEGVLSLWHISGWEGAYGTTAAWLGARIREYEKKTPGVFIEMNAMSQEKFKARLERGECPDLLSFPTGALSEPQETLGDVIPNPNIRGALMQSACGGMRAFAVPYAMGGYLLAVNDDMLYDNQLCPPSGEGWSAEDLRQVVEGTYEKPGKKKEAIRISGLCIQDKKNAVPAAALMYHFGKGNISDALALLDSGNVLIGNAVDEFVNRNAASAIISMSEWRMLKSRQNTGKAPAYSVCGVSAFSDMVQYIGVSRGLDAKKYAVCQGFIDHLLGDGAQAKLKAVGAFPASSRITQLYEGDEQMASIETAYEKDVRVPNAYSYAGKREEIRALIDEVMSGADRLLSLRRAISSACK